MVLGIITGSLFIAGVMWAICAATADSYTEDEWEEFANKYNSDKKGN